MNLSRYAKIRNAIFLCAAIFVSAPLASAEGEGNGIDVYKSVLPTKSLLSSRQFIVIDDFNSRKLTNQFGALWLADEESEEALALSTSKVDSRNPVRGGALEIKYDLKASEKAILSSNLNRLDASQARSLIFKCKLDAGKNFKGRVRIHLADDKEKEVVRDVTESCLKETGEWNDVIVPMEVFKNLDLDYLETIRIKLAARQQEEKGALLIDEVAFFGFNDVGFESNRDNLSGYPRIIYDEKRRSELIKERGNKKLLRKIAEDTWQYFLNARDKDTALVVDHIRMGDGALAANYTSPTNIAMGLLSAIGAADLRIISKEESIAYIREVMDTLNAMPKFEGFFYNFYETKKMFVTRSYISSVDSGWLAVALVIVRQAYPEEFHDEATALLDAFDFGEFLDPENNQMVIGFDVPKREFGNYHYGMLVTEARATSLYAIGKGDVPSGHWWFLYRTLPETWKWQTQEPQGKMTERDSVDYFQGYYEKNGKKFVPSWGGSMFEYLMPTLVLDENQYAKKGLGLNNKVITDLHIDYALNEKEYPVWGISPAATSNGRSWDYQEYGVKSLASKGYRDRGIITPHVTFLALDTRPKEAIKNIRNLLKFQNIYGAYGFYDTINLKNERVNPQYLALDQGMIFVAIVNYLNKGSIQKRFHKDPIGQAIEGLLKEDFFST